MTRYRETADDVDDDISEFGWRDVQAGLHRKGSEPECKHEWELGVNEDGSLAEPPYDVCLHCGKIQH